ncbi:ROK family protein [Flexithrix dorotheae]|uniref:ROK family protein n=1 Tax=Flexithrix dorotheae TaxID=70993 RepID=UPI0005C63A84|nr:ROK family protein [Flexithrix dorotheae]
MGNYAIGIDLGGTNIKAILINEDGEILAQRQQPIIDTVKDNGAQWKNSIKEFIEELKSISGVNTETIGIAAPGLPDHSNHNISFMPGRLYGLENFNWSEFLQEENVMVINDAQAALIAESKIGAGKDYSNLLMVTLGTGVGGGIMIDGKIHQGNGQRAGHLGHISLDFQGHCGITGIPGSLEDAIGNSTIEKRSLGKYLSTASLVEDYKKGKPFASWIWLDSVRKLAIGLASFCNVLSPDKIILGGGICNAGKALFTPLEEFMENYEWKPGGLKVPIVKAKCNEFSGAVGAAFFAMVSSSEEKLRSWKLGKNKIGTGL